MLPAGVLGSLGIAAAFFPLRFAGEGSPGWDLPTLTDANGLFEPPKHPKTVPIYWYLSMKQQWVSPHNPKLRDINPRPSLKANTETLVTLGLGTRPEIKKFGDSVITIAGFY